MDTDIVVATFNEKDIIWRLLQFYFHELSVFTNLDLNDEGEYSYEYFDDYWKEKERIPYLLRINGRLGGFCLVNSHCLTKTANYSIAEFFILRKYRGKGIGFKFAEEIINRVNTSIEIRCINNNQPAIEFWVKTLNKIKGIETIRASENISDWDGPVWIVKRKNGTEQGVFLGTPF